MRPTRPWIRRIVIAELALIALVLIVTGWFYWQSRAATTAFNGMLLDPPQDVPVVRLQGSDGQAHALTDFRGKVTVVFFGYTHCPDVCPMTASTVTRARELLGNQADRIQFVFVSVDPERDTPERLASYLAKYDSSYIGLTGDEQAIQELATAFGVHYAKVQSTSALGYLVEHTASTFVLDREGRLRAVLPFGLTPEQMASDLRTLLRS
ncbi:SCO family protein [Thermomicrobium sp. CFH 73360]|uniref:SCO family protein n=1 Tax=Thermomicrobium sp. CFH 73360 TaxID=2951987 RepID=UPI002076BB5D|nr:SCO family protein [Thermomicrobium sp. CFH 73360]MCM8745573.1 SCO family protein [Thermomicrobium sp. CFH 73360]